VSKNIDQDLLARLADGLPAEEAALCIGRVLRIHRDTSEALAYTEERAHRALVAQSNLQVQLGITSDDRDARRRRMELAATILDYERTLPIEELCGVLLGTLVTLTLEDYAQYQRDRQELIDIINSNAVPVPSPRSFGNGANARPAYNTPNGEPTTPDITSIPSAPPLVVCLGCGANNLAASSTCAVCARPLNKDGSTANPISKCLECDYTGLYFHEPGSGHQVSCSLYRAPRG
jgi:hypothetical protein